MTGTHVWNEKHGVSPANRRKDDDYPTPCAALDALMPFIQDFPAPIWEPCAGSGSLVRAMTAQGLNVKSMTGNFFDVRRARGASIVTNPPYGDGLAEKFIRHTIALGIEAPCQAVEV